MSLREWRPSALLMTALLAFSLTGGLAATARAAPPWKVVTYGRVQFRVPGAWPVVDMAAHPTGCIRLDVSAVYLGRQGGQPDCPAVVVGRTNAVYVEPLDARSVGVASFTTTPTTLNNEKAYLGVETDTGGTLIAAFPQLGALASVSFGVDRALSERILATFGHAPGTPRLSRTSLPKPRRVTSPPRPPSANPVEGHPVAPQSIYTGEGFDACTAPSTATMSAWLASPYRSIGIYIGGINRGCAQPNLNPEWVAAVVGQGWSLVPIYVGLQAPCTGFLNRIDPTKAASQGISAANDAVAQAQLVGLGSGDPIYFDMESYSDSITSCVQAVETFISAWVGQLHLKGYLAAMYGGAASGIRDEASIYNDPNYNRLDDIWYAHWDLKHVVFGDPYFPDDVWPDHQRLHQYQGGHNETYGGVTINIDGDYNDGAVACSYVGTQVAPSPTAGIPPGAVGTPGPRFDVFDLGPAGSVEHTSWTCPPGWSDAESLGGSLASGPAATSMVPGSDQEVFAQGTNAALWENVQDASGTWGGWASLGGVLTARPAAASWGPGRIDVFARGSDAHIWHKWRSGGTWSGWQNLGGMAAAGTGPTAASMGTGLLELFVRGNDAAVWEKSWNGSAWSGWTSLGGRIVGDPGAVSPHATQVQVFALGTDRSIWYDTYTSAGWDGWKSIGGVLTSGPAVATGQATTDVTAVFAIGTDGAIWEKRYKGAWSSWLKVP